MRFRQATEQDVDEITGCVRAAYRRYVRRIGRRPGPMRLDYRRVIRDQSVTVAEDGGRVIGVLVLGTTRRGFLLDNIAVHPAEQGRGIGAALLSRAEGVAKTAGYRAIYLYTHIAMKENRALYERLGYREFARRTECGFRRVYMRKCLR